MLRLTTRCLRKKVNLTSFTPGVDKHGLQSELKSIGKKIPLNPVSLTNYKIEKRTSWPKTYPVRIFNADGSSFIIDHDKPQAVIQLPKITEDTDEVRKIFIRRTGIAQKDYTEFEDEPDVVE